MSEPNRHGNVEEMAEDTAPERRGLRSIVRPATDIVENDERFFVIVDLPGFDLRDICVAVADDVLEVDATRKPETRDPGDAYLRNERMYGSIARAYALPGRVDPVAATATYSNGVLEVHLPRSDRESPLRLEIPVAPRNPYRPEEQAQEE